MTNPQLFLTDYASYNNGTQFEFGHWVDLSKFTDKNEFDNYIKKHFKKCDKINPLDSPREEIMFTDFDNLPDQLYCESYDNNLMEKIFEFINLSEINQISILSLIDYFDINDAFKNYENITPQEWGGTMAEKYELFEIYYPVIAEYENDYVNIDYDRFINEEFQLHEIYGRSYLISKNELQHAII